MRFSVTFLLATIGALLISGCSTARVAGPQTQTAGAHPESLEIGGLSLSVYPMTKKSEVKETFKLDLLGKGVLPLRVKAENRNPSTSFIIARESVFVMNESTQATNSPQHGQIARELATWSHERQVSTVAATALAVPLIVAPFVLFKAATTSTNEVFIDKRVEDNLAGKEFQTRTLGPGQRAEGFIYFRFSKGTDPSSTYHVVSQIKNLSTGEMTPFDLKVNLDLKAP